MVLDFFSAFYEIPENRFILIWKRAKKKDLQDLAAGPQFYFDLELLLFNKYFAILILTQYVNSFRQCTDIDFYPGILRNDLLYQFS